MQHDNYTPLPLAATITNKSSVLPPVWIAVIFRKSTVSCYTLTWACQAAVVNLQPLLALMPTKIIDLLGL